MFIVLEGVEGAGKSTQAKRLVAWLERSGAAVESVREPGGVALSEAIRGLLLDSAAVPARVELLLLLAARAALVEERLRPALDSGKMVVADRYDLSTLAYQVHGRGLPEAEVRALNAFATGGVRPDLTIVLDVPVELGAARRARRRPDRIERAGSEFHARVAGAYRLLARSEPGVALVDASGSAAAVHEAVVELVRLRFPETFPGAPGSTG